MGYSPRPRQATILNRFKPSSFYILPQIGGICKMQTSQIPPCLLYRLHKPAADAHLVFRFTADIRLGHVRHQQDTIFAPISSGGTPPPIASGGTPPPISSGGTLLPRLTFRCMPAPRGAIHRAGARARLYPFSFQIPCRPRSAQAAPPATARSPSSAPQGMPRRPPSLR